MPFSFLQKLYTMYPRINLTGVSWYPPILAFSVVNRSDGTKKDTLINIEKVPEFVINIVSVDLLPVDSLRKSKGLPGC